MFLVRESTIARVDVVLVGDSLPIWPENTLIAASRSSNRCRGQCADRLWRGLSLKPLNRRGWAITAIG